MFDESGLDIFPFHLYISQAKDVIMRIRVPPNRMTPLRENWEQILTPLVEHLKLQVRMNVKRRCVELKVLSHFWRGLFVKVSATHKEDKWRKNFFRFPYLQLFFFEGPLSYVYAHKRANKEQKKLNNTRKFQKRTFAAFLQVALSALHGDHY